MLRYEELSSAELAGLAQSSLFILPVGSLEQHCEGPLGADLMIAQGVAEAACEELSSRGLSCVLMPPIAYGFSWEWSSAPGTISVPLEVLRGLLLSIAGSLSKAGARTLVAVNGHYGNWPALEASLREIMASSAGRLTVVLVNYWQVLGVDAGHASDFERAVLEALGRRVSFGRCEEASPSPVGASTFTGPIGLASIPSSELRGLSRELIGRTVADAIVRALESAKRSRVVP